MLKSLIDVSEEELKVKTLSELVEGMTIILLSDRNVLSDDYKGPLKDVYFLYRAEIDRREKVYIPQLLRPSLRDVTFDSSKG